MPRQQEWYAEQLSKALEILGRVRGGLIGGPQDDIAEEIAEFFLECAIGPGHGNAE